MAATNYDDVLRQLHDAGLIIPPREGLRIGTHKPIRVQVQDGGREKRGWYWLREWSPSTERLLIVGAFGVWRGNSRNEQKVALPDDDTGRITAEQREAMRRVWAEAARAAELQRKKEAAIASQRAERVWQRLETFGESPYLVNKGVRGHQVRYTEHGSVVVPLMDVGGRIHGLQFIRTPAQAKESKRPAKEFWPAGLAMKGAFHMIGAPHWIILVAEGYATAATLYEATGYPVAVAFNAGNLRPVAEALRKRYKQSKILICADDDILGKCKNAECKARIALPLHPTDCPACGEPHGYTNAGVDGASAAAMACSGEWVAVRFPDQDARIAGWLDKGTKATDFNDLHALQSLAMVRDQISDRLGNLSWHPPVLRAESSSNSGEGGKLRPIQYPGDLLVRYSLVYGANNAVFDRQEHCLVALADMRNLCLRPDVHKAWMEHPDRDVVRQDEVGFDPAESDPRITCNLWGGWPTVARPGKCTLLLELLEYMCSNESRQRELYEWVLKWVAYPIQHPGAKMKSTIVVHGPQGTGKNLFFEAVMGIYGKYGRILDQDALTDKHNDWASRKLFLIADEVVAQAHRFEVKNKLKTLITGTWIRINPKHIAAYDEANHVNMVFLSNESMPVVLEEDDRRHCIIWTPEKKPKEFYAALLHEIEHGGIEALHDHLLNIDLGDFNPGTPPPETQAKLELIDLAQDSPVEFVDAVYRHDVKGAIAKYEDGTTLVLPGLTQDWFEIYRVWCSQVGVKPASLKRFVSSIDKRRGIRADRKRYLVAASEFQLAEKLGPHSVLMFDNAPPEGTDEAEWLGKHIAALKSRLSELKGSR